MTRANPARRERDGSDIGFTLIELLLYSVLMIVVLVIVGGLLINSLSTERTVREASQSANVGQLVATSVGHGIRGATDVWHNAPGTDPELLMTRTTGPTSGQPWICQAWAYSGGDIRVTTSSSAIAAGQTPDSIRGWTLLAAGAQPVIAGGAPLPVFTVSGRRVDVNVNVSDGGSKPVLIHTSSVPRLPAAAPGDAPTCF
jgi:type II secretory pathway pseudopilin PulG